MKIELIIIFGLILLINSGYALAYEPIPITYSHDLEEIIFDGKWSTWNEWKRSTLTSIEYEKGEKIQLRTAHLGDFIYVFVDATKDTSLDYNEDRVIICFDSNNDKSSVSDDNDYCFMASLEGKRSFAFQGGSFLALNGNFKKIPNPNGYIGISSVSGSDDRYSKIPHGDYEFRIPIELLGRNSVYGFYFSYYDFHTNMLYSWPQDVIPERSFQIPSPSKWGEIYSPDKSLPEFEWPILTFLPAIAIVIYLSRLQMYKSCNGSNNC